MADEQYTVTNQVQSNKLIPGVGLQDGYTVYWATTDGHQGNVWVPANQYNADRVRSQILASIATMREVAQSGQ